MPQPNKNEKKSDYIGRCVKEVMSEGKSQKESLGRCYGMWDAAKKKAKASVIVGKEEFLMFDEEG